MLSELDTGAVTPVVLARDAAAIITSVDDGVEAMLGWRPDQLVGLPSTQFIHPEDQPSAVAAWMEMIIHPGSVRVWQGRYRTAAGSWRWVEVVNENHLDQPEAIVLSSMRLVTVDPVGLEEELRARKQLLNRLSDALPVGVVQIDRNGAIAFTNDKLHAIVGAATAATVDSLFAGVAAEDRHSLDSALAAVLAEQAVDDIEFRLETPTRRVCQLSLRPLTDGDGIVNGAIGCLSDVTDRVSLRRELEIRASLDPLTRCLNRSATLELLTTIIARHTGAAPGTALMYIDLDHFKAINDLHGHAAGDRVLVQVSTRLRGALRDLDHIGRLGGDEFLVICPDVENHASAMHIADRLADAFTGAIDVGEATMDTTASIGVSFSTAIIPADALIARADEAMYASKRARTRRAVTAV